MTDDALLINDEGLRDTVDTEIDASLTFRIPKHQGVGVAVLRQERESGSHLILVLEAHHRILQFTAADKLHDVRMLFPAAFAPGSPDIQEPDLPLQLITRHRAVKMIQILQLERRRRFPDEGRRHLMRIQIKPLHEEPRQHDKERKRQKILQLFHNQFAPAAPTSGFEAFFR